MTDKWGKLKKYLEEEKRDCLKLQQQKDLTSEGKGMLMQIEAIEEIFKTRHLFSP